ILEEQHFPYVVCLQGSSFATSFGMQINQNYCRNRLVELDGNMQMLQATLLYFQSDPWSAGKMRKILWDVANRSHRHSGYKAMNATNRDGARRP
ncbi:MAG: hypothetical protein OXC62_05355, partial [Aestuariivita sp.]|nr:hypothetical protein [Aestuariivita sp.]